MKSQNVSRREFLKQATIIASAALAAGSGIISCQKGKKISEAWYLNPAFRIKEISENEIQLFTHLGNGEKLQYQFKGLEADLFRSISEEKNLESLITPFTEKHQLNEKECRKQVEQFLQEYDNAKLIYTGKKMLVKIVEADNE